MQYKFLSNKLICIKCNAHIKDSLNDRHSCFWKELENADLGFAAMILAGQFKSWNKLEQAIAKNIWHNLKIKHFPKKIKHLKILNTTNIEVYSRWTKHGDNAIKC